MLRLQWHSFSLQVPGAGRRRVRLLERRGRGDLKLLAEPALCLQQAPGFLRKVAEKGPSLCWTLAALLVDEG